MNEGVTIRGLRVATRVGVTEQERATPQDVSVDLEIEADLSRAAETDDLHDTIDYAEVVARVARAAREGEVRLLEHLAGKIASSITDVRRVKRVSVEIAKVKPPLDEKVERVAVRIERRQA